MNKVKLTKTGKFDAAHRLPHHPGKCANIHGHTWKWEVEIVGTLGNDPSGMLVDFAELKKTINHYDHSLILDVHDDVLVSTKLGTKVNVDIYTLPFVPTCENLATVFVNMIGNLPVNGRLLKVTVTLYETDTSSATRSWEAEE